MSEDLGRLKGRPKRDGAIHPLLFFGDDFCASGDGSSAMPCMWVITLDKNGVLFSDHVTIFRQHIRKCIPIIRKKRAIF